MAVNKMLKFVTVTRDMPSKRAAGERRTCESALGREAAASDQLGWRTACR